jgi:hypothetical protein
MLTALLMLTEYRTKMKSMSLLKLAGESLVFRIFAPSMGAFILPAHRSWLKHYAAIRKVAGSILDDHIAFLQLA